MAPYLLSGRYVGETPSLRSANLTYGVAKTCEEVMRDPQFIANHMFVPVGFDTSAIANLRGAGAIPPGTEEKRAT